LTLLTRLALFGELADDPKAKKFAAKHLSGKGLRLLDKIARLGLNSTGLVSDISPGVPISKFVSFC